MALRISNMHWHLKKNSYEDIEIQKWRFQSISSVFEE